MKRIVLMGIALVGAYIAAHNPAHAISYNWSYVCDWDLPFCNGSGTLETNAAPGPVLVNAISGTFGGNTITGIVPAGNYSNDNLLLALSPSVEISGSGIVFSIGPNTYVRIYHDFDSDRALVISPGCGDECPAAQYDGVFSVSSPLSAGETPIPAALPLFATGLAALGFVAHRRKRKAIA